MGFGSHYARTPSKPGKPLLSAPDSGLFAVQPERLTFADTVSQAVESRFAKAGRKARPSPRQYCYIPKIPPPPAWNHSRKTGLTRFPSQKAERHRPVSVKTPAVSHWDEAQSDVPRGAFFHLESGHKRVSCPHFCATRQLSSAANSPRRFFRRAAFCTVPTAPRVPSESLKVPQIPFPLPSDGLRPVAWRLSG